MLIDTHAHLNFKAFAKDLDKVIKRTSCNKIKKIIIPGANIDSSKKAVEIAQKYSSCYAAIGIHPHHLPKSNIEFDLIKKNLFDLAKQKKTVAIGEIGLDYYHYHGYPPISTKDKIKQKELLQIQLDLALKIKKPLILHCRDAFNDLLSILDSFKNTKLRGVFHCFSGEKKHLQKALKLGYYVGFDGNITYPENIAFLSLIKMTPLNFILVETDSPFLTPVPLRGERNEPKNLTYIISFIAKIFRKRPRSIAKITTQNALDLFRFH